jgi:hypothetical protein
MMMMMMMMMMMKEKVTRGRKNNNQELHNSYFSHSIAVIKPRIPDGRDI